MLENAPIEAHYLVKFMVSQNVTPKDMIRWLWRYVRSILYSEGMTPLPTKVLSLLFLVNLLSGMTNVMCFSYLPKMVKSFGISEVDTGRYAGLIATSFYVGYILFSPLWGILGDKKGNKLALTLSISLISMTTLAFGYSTSLNWAVVSRFLQGCSMGVTVLCKSILAHALDETNTSLGFSIFFTCWTFSFIIGPSTAGFLVYPAQQYPGLFSEDSLFGQFGVLLPNLILVASNNIILIASLISLPDDWQSEKNLTEVRQSLVSYSKFYNSSEETIELRNYRLSNGHVTVGVKNPGRKKHLCCSRFWRKLSSQLLSGVRKFKELFKIRDFVITVHANAILGFSVIGIEEMFPVFAATSREYHGLNLSTSEIGVVLLISSPFLLIIQVFVTSRVSKRYGERKTFIGCALLLVFTVTMIPTLTSISNSTSQRACTVFLTLLNQVFINGTFVALNIMVNNAVTEDVYGSANGVASAMHCFGRVIAPSIFGTLYTWSLTNVQGVYSNEDPLGFPLNQFFIFYLCALSLFACALIVSTVSPKLDSKCQR